MNRLVSVVIGVVLVGLVGAPSGAAPAAAGERVMSGTVVAGSGEPVAGALVEATVEQWRGDNAFREQPLGEATTDSTGQFAILGAVAPGATRNPDGSVNVLLRVVAEATEKYFLVSAVPPVGSGTSWAWGEQADQSLVPEQTRGASGVLAGEPVAALRLSMSGATPLAAADASRASDRTPDRTPDRAAARGSKITLAQCYGATTYYIVWVFSGRKRDRMMPIQKLDTQTHSKAKLFWSNSRNSTFTEIFKVPEHRAYSLGLSYSRIHARGAGLTWKSPNKFHGLYRLDWRYRKYVQYCTTSALADTRKELQESDAAVRTGKSRWRSFKWLSGNRPYSVFDSFLCHEATGPRISYANLWVMRKTSHRLQAYASLVGVGLEAQQKNSRIHKVKYLLDRDSKFMKLCGNDNDPVHATLVREVDY